MPESRLDILISAKNNASGAIHQVEGDLKGLGSVASQMAGGLAAGLGAAAVAGLANMTVELAQAGAQAERTAASFEFMAGQVGASAGAMRGALRSASQGMVSDTELMLSANRAMALGVADTATEMGALMEVAAARARVMGISTAQAFNDIVTGIGRMSPLILDNLGIVTGGEAVFEDYAASIGTTADALSDAEKKQALINSILQSSIPLLENTAGRARDTAGSFEAMAAQSANLRDNLGTLVTAGLGPAAEALAKFLAQLNLGLKIFEMWRELPEGGALSWYHFKRALDESGTSSESTSFALQALADAENAASAAAGGLQGEIDNLNASFDSARRSIDSMAAGLLGLMGAGGALAWADDMNDELNAQAQAWQAQGFELDEIANVLMPGWVSQQRDATRELTRTHTAVTKVNKEYQQLESTVKSVLSGGLDPGVGVDPDAILEEMGLRPDALNEAARRLADVAVNGFDSPWVDYLRTEFPALWAQYFSGAMDGGNLKAQAAQLLKNFQDGLVPELIDRERAKDLVRRLITGEQNMAALAQEIAAELAAEMGVSVNEAMGAARTALGVGTEGGGAGVDAATAFDSGLAQGLSATNTGGNYIAQLEAQMRASFRLIVRAGQDAGREFAAGFATGSASIPQTFIDMLVQMITPGVEAALGRRATQTGAVP